MNIFEYFDFLFFLILICTVVIRIIPSLILKIDNPDAFYHLTAARQILNEKKIPSKLNSFLFEGTYSYPPLLHLLLVPIARNNKLFLGRLISPTVDTLIGILVYFVAKDIFGTEIGLISFLLYALIPINVFESTKISPRTLGHFFLVLFMFSTFYVNSNQIELLIISVISVAGVLITHKMATQSLVMVSLFTSFIFLFIDIDFSIFMIGSLALGILLSIGISKGFYLKIFRGHKAVLSYHFKYGDYQKGEKKFGSLFQIIQQWPWLILIPPALVLSNFWESLQINNLNFLLVFGGFFVAMSILWRYGDSSRYLVYGTSSLSIIFAYFLWTELQDFFLIFLIISLGISLVRILIYLKKYRKTPLITNELQNCFNYIRNISDNSVGCIPPSLNYQTAFFTEKKVLSGEVTPEQFKKKRDYSSLVKDDKSLLSIIQEFKTNTYLVDCNNSLSKNFESIINESKIIQSLLLYQSSSYKIYKISPR